MQVRTALAGAEHVVTSRLTFLECSRVLIQAVATARIDEARSSQLTARLAAADTRWDVLSLDETILERAQRAFPVEPIRTLDAIHLASVLEARSAIPDIALLSLDRRIRNCAEQLGFRVLPHNSVGDHA